MKRFSTRSYKLQVLLMQVEEMKGKEVINIKRVFEMGLEVGMQLQKAIDNMKVGVEINER